MSFLLPSCRESLPAFDTISSPKSNMPANEPFISKGTVEYSSNCEFLLKIYHFPSFWKSLSSTKPTYTPTLSVIYALTMSDRGQGSLNADVSENILPFVSQSINNFRDYDISQSVDWEYPSLSRHVLLIICNKDPKRPEAHTSHTTGSSTVNILCFLRLSQWGQVLPYLAHNLKLLFCRSFPCGSWSSPASLIFASTATSV